MPSTGSWLGQEGYLNLIKNTTCHSYQPREFFQPWHSEEPKNYSIDDLLKSGKEPIAGGNIPLVQLHRPHKYLKLLENGVINLYG